MPVKESKKVIKNPRLLLRQMEKFGYQADAVANRVEAVKEFEMVNYDIVFMDVQMSCTTL